MVSRQELLAAAAIYQSFFYDKANRAQVECTVELMTFGGFKASADQFKRKQKEVNLGDFRKFVEEDDREKGETTKIVTGVIREED